MNDAPFEAIVIGASAGAVEALSVLLSALPADFALPIIVVVHVPPDRPSALAELFRAKCRLPVIEVEDKQPIEGRAVYFAPPNYHLLIDSDRSFSLSCDDPVLFSRPSIDVMFESAADIFGAGLLGIVLTGANQDGAAGLEAILSAGGSGMVQDPEEAYMSAMPEAAISRCPSARVLPLSDIAAFLTKVF